MREDAIKATQTSDQVGGNRAGNDELSSPARSLSDFYRYLAMLPLLLDEAIQAGDRLARNRAIASSISRRFSDDDESLRRVNDLFSELKRLRREIERCDDAIARRNTQEKRGAIRQQKGDLIDKVANVFAEISPTPGLVARFAMRLTANVQGIEAARATLVAVEGRVGIPIHEIRHLLKDALRSTAMRLALVRRFGVQDMDALEGLEREVRAATRTIVRIQSKARLAAKDLQRANDEMTSWRVWLDQNGWQELAPLYKGAGDAATPEGTSHELESISVAAPVLVGSEIGRPEQVGHLGHQGNPSRSLMPAPPMHDFARAASSARFLAIELAEAGLKEVPPVPRRFVGSERSGSQGGAGKALGVVPLVLTRNEGHYARRAADRAIIGRTGERLVFDKEKARWRAILEESPGLFAELLEMLVGNFWRIAEEHQQALASSLRSLDGSLLDSAIFEGIIWPASTGLGDRMGFDLFGPDSAAATVRCIEVKTTEGPASTPFEMTLNEYRAAERLGSRYELVRVWNLGGGKPCITTWRDPVRLISEGTLCSSPGAYIVAGEVEDLEVDR